jgi:hypothetical protein
MKRLQTVGILGSLLLLGGCGSNEDRNIEAGLAEVSAHRSEHPHYPVMAFDDFGADNGPVGIPVDVFSFYCHATTQPNPLEQVTAVGKSSHRLATVFAKAIQSLITLEASTPAPRSPYPTTREWKLAPHPAPGTYEIIVQNGMKTLTFQVRCPVQSGESADAAVAKVQPQLMADAEQVVAAHVQLEKSEMKSLMPPPGFVLVTQEMLAAQKGVDAVDPHQVGDRLCLVPVDKQLAMAGLAHSIKKLLTATGRLNPKPKVANLVIQGPEFNETYPVPLTPGNNQDQAVAQAEKDVASRLDELNRKAS